ncbi:14615_t:CDS:1, partial [Racocetra persica]
MDRNNRKLHIPEQTQSFQHACARKYVSPELTIYVLQLSIRQSR